MIKISKLKDLTGQRFCKLTALYYNIKDRCYNKNSTSYKDYGARDIKVCQEWLDDFMNFYNWAINSNYDTVQSRLRYSWPVDRALELK